MKKILSTLLSFTLLLSASFTFAENNTEEMERLLVSVKSRIDDTEGYTEFSSNSYSSEYGTTYDFSWSHSDDKYYKSLNVSCNSEGIITYYSAYDSSKSNREKALSITGTKRAEALTVATEKVKQLNPDIAHSLVVSDSESFESFRNDGFSFLIQRYENGIPVLYDTGRIYLNADCSLNNFYLNYTTGLSFESNENKISKANAASLYNSNIGLDLYYISSYDYPDNHTAELVYSQKNDNKYIHAVTGEVYEIKENYEAGYSNNAKLEESVTMDSAAGGLSYRKQLSDAELKTVLEVENLLSDSDVDEIIKSFDFLGIPDDITLNSSSFYYNNSLKTYIYNLTYKTDTNQVADVNINAQTGEILYFYK